MVQNQPCWDACYTVGLSNQRQVKLYLCDSVALFWMSHCVTSDPLWWLYTAWSDRVKGPYTRHWKIGHFRVPLCLCFKASLSAKPFIWKWVWFECKWNCMQNSFSYRKGFDSFWHRGTRELGNGLFSSRWIKKLPLLGTWQSAVWHTDSGPVSKHILHHHRVIGNLLLSLWSGILTRWQLYSRSDVWNLHGTFIRFWWFVFLWLRWAL